MPLLATRHEQRVANYDEIIVVRNDDGPEPATPVPVTTGGIWRIPLTGLGGYTPFVPHDATTGVWLRGGVSEGLPLVEAWSMAGEEPVLLASTALVLPSVPISTVAGLALTPMGDRTGWYLAYDRGGGSTDQTIKAQLVHVTGTGITTGPSFTWDEETHDLVAWGSWYLLYQHQIVGLDETTAVRFWTVATNAAGENPTTGPDGNIQQFPYDAAVHVELLKFNAGLASPPTVTDLGLLPGAPTGTTLQSLQFWTVPSDGRAVVYWALYHYDSFTHTATSTDQYVSVYTEGGGWSPSTLLASEAAPPSPLFVYLSAPLHDGNVFFHGMSGLVDTSGLDWIVHATDGGADIVAARDGLNLFTIEGGTATSINAFADTDNDGAINAYLTVESDVVL